MSRVADSAFAGRHGHVAGARADQARLRRVADPARHGECHVRADGQQQAEKQRLAAGAADNRIRAGRQPPPAPVTRRCIAEDGQPGDRAVGAQASCGRQRIAEGREHRQPGLAEGERQHRLAEASPAGKRLVGSEGGRYRHPGAGHAPRPRGRGLHYADLLQREARRGDGEKEPGILILAGSPRHPTGGDPGGI